MNNENGPTNRLARETSPYLLQHATNPVDWYPWGEEAFEKARKEDKPLILSVGYAACHWCHVMEHESFQDPATAKLMNDHFVSVKVDREERPDIDEIYMSFVQALSGHGGWPMTVFLTPEGKPFFGGTYYPPTDRHGMPGFGSLLNHISTRYADKREDVLTTADGWARQLSKMGSVPGAGESTGKLEGSLLDQSADQMSRHFDAVNGGFGGAPKFPHPMDLTFFMRIHRSRGRPDLLAQVRKSLDKMAAGGIYDQLGGGFHRYSVDDQWAVPHFEKMLYDNALLARTYLDAHVLTEEAGYRQVGVETLEYVLREMRDPAGGFWSSQDADSEGEEGKFFAWTPEEVKAALEPAAAELICACLGVETGGNFEHGSTVLHLALTPEEFAKQKGTDAAETRKLFDTSRVKLLDVRNERIHPATDDKVLTSWNGLMISALARGHEVTGEARYLEAAAGAAEFITTRMVSPEGHLLRTYREGRAKLDAFLEDHGAMILALLDLHAASFDTVWIDRAVELGKTMIEKFWDDEEGAFHFTSRDQEKLIVRTKPFADGATPSGNSLAAAALVQLGRMTGSKEFTNRAERLFGTFASVMAQSPGAFSFMLGALHTHLEPGAEIAIVGDPEDERTGRLVGAVRATYLPGRLLALLRPEQIGSPLEDSIPLLKDKTLVDGSPAAYVCRNFACQAPVTEPGDLERELNPA